MRWWKNILAADCNANGQPARAHLTPDDAAAESRAEYSAEGGAGLGSRRAPQRRCGPATSIGTMETDLQRLAAACNKAAEHYCENPAGPETVVDIYRAMAALASMLDNQIKAQPIIQKRLH